MNVENLSRKSAFERYFWGFITLSTGLIMACMFNLGVKRHLPDTYRVEKRGRYRVIGTGVFVKIMSEVILQFENDHPDLASILGKGNGATFIENIKEIPNYKNYAFHHYSVSESIVSCGKERVVEYLVYRALWLKHEYYWFGIPTGIPLCTGHEIALLTEQAMDGL